ncbi:MAG: hypothetical protein RL223_2450 [Pseudomonadota bacterium]
MGVCADRPASRPMPQIPLPPALRRALSRTCLPALTLALSASMPILAAPPTPQDDDATRLAAVELDLRQTPQDAALRFRRARLLESAGRLAEAEQAWRQMTLDFPQLAEPFNNLAVRRAAAGDVDGARPLLEQALLRDPDYRLARLNLADVLLAQAHQAGCLAADIGPPDATLDGRLQALATLRGTTPGCPPAWRRPAAPSSVPSTPSAPPAPSAPSAPGGR